MLEGLSDRPGIDRLAHFVERVLRERGEEIEFLVLFGSMARGNWSPGSDYDVLLGLRNADGRRLIDRIGEFEALVEGDIQVFPYDRPAWERMFQSFHPLLLEALDHGVVLSDRGSFASMRAVFERWRTNGTLTRLAGGWKIAE